MVTQARKRFLHFISLDEKFEFYCLIWTFNLHTTCHKCQQSYFNKTPSKVNSMKFKCHYSLKAHQNDQLNLSFVKNKHICTYVVGEKMARNCHKMAIYKVIFFSKQSILIITLLTFQMSLNESISVIRITNNTYVLRNIL